MKKKRAIKFAPKKERKPRIESVYKKSDYNRIKRAAKREGITMAEYQRQAAIFQSKYGI